MTPATPARAAARSTRTRREADRNADAVMALVVGGFALMAALPFLDLFGIV